MQSGGRSCHGTLVLGIDSLEILHIISRHLTAVYDITRHGGRAQGKQLTLKLIMGTVIEETQGSSTTGGIIYHLRYHRTIILKEQFITNTYLTCRFYQDIPQAQLLIEFTQQEHLNFGICLLLGTIETGREHLRVVEHQGITFIEIINYVTEQQRLVCILSLAILLEDVNGLALTMDHHQTTFIAAIDFLHGTILVLKRLMRWFQCHLLLWQLKFKL